MLELPEAAVISKQMDEKLRGLEIARVIAAKSPHGFAFYTGDPASYEELLKGRKVDKVHAWAGQIEMCVGDMRLVFSEGTNLRYLAAGEKIPDKHQLYVGFDDGSGFVCTVQMYGFMYLFKDGEGDNIYYQVSVQKPTPFTDEFDKAYFDEIVKSAGPKASAKALLATQQRIPGLGNGCLHDILWNARVNPQTKLSALTDKDIDAIFNSVKSTLKEMTQKNGRDTEKDFFGKPGGYMTRLSNKTAAYPCPECGGPITKKAYMGGNVYFCTACQPL